MITAIITAAVLAFVGALVWIITRLSHRQGVAEAAKDDTEAGDEARRVRDETEMETRHLSDAELADRLRKYHRSD